MHNYRKRRKNFCQAQLNTQLKHLNSLNIFAWHPQWMQTESGHLVFLIHSWKIWKSILVLEDIISKDTLRGATWYSKFISPRTQHQLHRVQTLKRNSNLGSLLKRSHLEAAILYFHNLHNEPSGFYIQQTVSYMQGMLPAHTNTLSTDPFVGNILLRSHISVNGNSMQISKLFLAQKFCHKEQNYSVKLPENPTSLHPMCIHM